MKLIVTDANILIQLSSLELMDCFCGMHFEIHTTDYIIDEYNRGEEKVNKFRKLDRFIRAGKIIIHEYGYDVIMSVYVQVKNQKKGLSPADCSVYKLSSDLNAVLLTGDRTLKLFSEQKEIAVRGIIWVLDEMKKHGVIDDIEYKEKPAELKTLSERLPVDEIDRRLK